MDLSIIILNYNGLSWIQNLLPNLKKNYLDKTAYQVEVVVVDNASTDGSQTFLATIDYIKCIHAKKNGGFAYGNNLAIKNTRARYVLLLNSDTELIENESSINLLLEYMDAHKEVAVVTPNLILSNGMPDKACHRGEPTPWAGFCYFSGLEKWMGPSKIFGRYHLTNLPQNTIHEIEACSGAAMLVKNSVIQEVGLLDEQFFMYAEDIDWCKRIREKGYKVVFYPTVKIIHHKYRSGLANTEMRAKTNHWFYKTMLQYYDKHYKTQYPSCFRWLLKWTLKWKESIER